ncbi:hypothetical protein [Methanotorris igneus]|uniref:Uncharacterized protein n=1 Tax=Methanotorris igneus (strain DSM 5666 / JCM 11834 / Kol 5) TaxID=880724 RepID=F6BDI0_METIK|nr:hypothetical protein [Methanotorris igneus]AEF96541.1 hypothetical protein Metig_0999 [Methanotorris igneus Kol 5]
MKTNKTIFLIVLFMLMNISSANIPYKWTSTIPVYFVPISSINNVSYYLSSDSIVVFYIDKDFECNEKMSKILPAINVYNNYHISPSAIPGNKTFKSIEPIFVYSKDGKKYIENFIVRGVKISENPPVYEVYDKKLFIPQTIDKNDKAILDVVGEYVAKKGGIFAYINKVPPYHKHVVVSGVVVEKIIPNPNGESAVVVAGRRIPVEVRDDEEISKKIAIIKKLSEIMNFNVTYITTGSENIEIIKKSSLEDDEKILLNQYWFKKWWGNYTHIYYKPSKDSENKNIDILAASYYPLIYFDKAPETFQNDPIGDYYPQTISYSGTEDVGYWNKGPKSENIYYYSTDEKYWEGDNNYCINPHWMYEGEYLPMYNNSEINENKYRYFSHWYVKNYGYALTKNVSGLLLFSNDKTLLDIIFGRDVEDAYWKLNPNGKIKYMVIPGKKNIEEENGITIIKIPGLSTEKIYGVNYIDEIYIPPSGEEFGIYIADIMKYDYDLINKLKDNYTYITSFRDYVNWINSYRKNSITIENNTIHLKSNNGIKITVYVNKSLYDILKDNNYKLQIEEYNKDACRFVISNPPKNLILN